MAAFAITFSGVRDSKEDKCQNKGVLKHFKWILVASQL